ncbi:MAG: extracellular solute-binding protein [Oscillospiraceae bacterium]|nr:extracellular solute-binding protein [Oscillospiraceae bacterium]
MSNNIRHIVAAALVTLVVLMVFCVAGCELDGAEQGADDDAAVTAVSAAAADNVGGGDSAAEGTAGGAAQGASGAGPGANAGADGAGAGDGIGDGGADGIGASGGAGGRGVGDGAGDGAGEGAPTDTQDVHAGKVTLLTWTDPLVVPYLRGMAERLRGVTGVELEVSDVDSFNYPQARQTHLMANNINIVAYEGGFTLPREPWNEALVNMPQWQEFVESGLFYDISGEAFTANYDEGILLESYGHRGRVYGLMTGVVPRNGVYYNVDKFLELGVDVPETWDELIGVCEHIKSAGYQPLTHIGGGSRMLGQYASFIATNMLLDEAPQVYRGLFLGEKKYTDPDVMTIFRALEQFSMYLEPDAVDMPYGEGYRRFAEGGALMLADDARAVGDVEAAGPDFAFSYFPLPGRERRDDGLMQQMGVDFGFAMVAVAASPDLGKVMDVFAFVSGDGEYPRFIAETGYFPTRTGVVYDNAFVKSMEAYMQKPRQNTPVYLPAPNGEGEPDGGASAAWFDIFLLKALGGPYTVEELAEETQKSREINNGLPD